VTVRASPPNRTPGGIIAVVAGLATTGALVGVVLLAANWYRQHLWLVWDAWGLRFFYFSLIFLTVLPGVLVGVLVGRKNRLRTALDCRDSEIETARSELARTNRALMALSAVNHELIRATDRDRLLERICQVMVDKSGYSLVWVGIPESGPAKRVRVAARAGEDASWLESLGIRLDRAPQMHGPTGTAIREGRMAFMPRLQEEPWIREWPDLPPQFARYTSAISFPMRIDDGRTVGALTIYERQQRDFGQEEIALLAQTAEDISHGLRFLRLSQSRERTTRLLRQALRASSAMSRTALELVGGDVDLREMASRVLRQALWLTGSPFGALAMVSRPTGRLDWLALTGPDGSIATRRPGDYGLYPKDDGRFAGPIAPTLDEGRPLLHNAPANFDGFELCEPGRGQVARFLSVPLQGTEHGPGGLLLLADAPAPYTDHDVRAVTRLAVLFDMAAARRRVEEELVIARRRAEAASEAKTQFLANVSHELRTPINGILGMAQLAILEGVDQREGEYWQTVRDSTDRLVEIVDNLLELANVESGSLSPQLREFSLRRVLDSLKKAFSVRAGLAGLTLALDVARGLPDKLLGAPFRLRQILANLIDNATRFTQAGGISIRAGRFEPGGAGGPRRVFVADDFNGLSIVFSVADTGIGIPLDKQASIFESFTLAEDYLTKRFGGTGMGLSIAKRLAELLGGSIWVESQPGQGSTFYLTVPFWPVADKGETPGAASGPVQLPTLRFLVVEDEAINRLALARGLRKLGHDVIEAGNGEDALRRLSMERVDVVIMDVQMPVMDGLTAVAHIRNGEVPGTNRRLPVVALTAYALEGDRQRFLEAGMDEFVTKPCDMDHLLRTVAKVLGVKPAA